MPDESKSKTETVRLNLDRLYTFHGTLYGPGPTDVPVEITVGTQNAPEILRPADEMRKSMERHRKADIAAGRIKPTEPNARMDVVKTAPAVAPAPAPTGSSVAQPAAQPAGAHAGGAIPQRPANVQR